MPTLLMMIGLPCSGKTTLVNKLNFNNHWFVISTNAIREQLATEYELTFAETFEPVWNFFVEKEYNRQLSHAFNNNLDTIIDQCNLGIKKRERLMDQFPNWRYWAIVLATPVNVCHARNLQLAEDRRVPDDEFRKMVKYGVHPAYTDGFDDIRIVQ